MDENTKPPGFPGGVGLASSRLAEVLVTLVEALNATSGVHDALLTGVERVASGADFHVVNRIGLAVFPLDGLVAGDGSAG